MWLLRFFFLISINLSVCRYCRCANILAIIPTPSYSHQIAFVNLWRELSLKGHQVTVLTTDPQNDPALENLIEIDLSSGYDLLKQKDWSVRNQNLNSIQYVKLFLQTAAEWRAKIMELPLVQKMLHDKTVHFDLVMVESVFPEFLRFGEHFAAPTIMMSSLEPSGVLHKYFSNEHHALVYPEPHLPFVHDLNFKERLIALVSGWLFEYYRHKIRATHEHLLIKHFPNARLTVHEMMEESSLFFISASPILLHPRALSPRTVIIGGGLIAQPKNLNKDVKEFLDKSTRGVIYFSLGTNVKTDSIEPGTLSKMIRVLGKLPYEVLWKFDNEEKYELPENVMIFSWVSQQDVLRHPNVKLFITQGGSQSVDEAILFEKPMVGLPIFGDQFSNIKKLELKGVAKYVNTQPSFDAGEFEKAILEVIDNTTYINNVKKINNIIRDQPLTGMEKAVWWTEYVIRHKGDMTFFKHAYKNRIPFYQYYYLDMLALVFVLLSLMSTILFLIIRFIYQRIRKLPTIIKNKKTIKKKKF